MAVYLSRWKIIRSNYKYTEAKNSLHQHFLNHVQRAAQPRHHWLEEHKILMWFVCMILSMILLSVMMTIIKNHTKWIMTSLCVSNDFVYLKDNTVDLNMQTLCYFLSYHIRSNISKVFNVSFNNSLYWVTNKRNKLVKSQVLTHFWKGI